MAFPHRKNFLLVDPIRHQQILDSHSGARAIGAFTRVFDALWRVNPKSIRRSSGYGFRVRGLRSRPE
jgi:hypothetical protein